MWISLPWVGDATAQRRKNVQRAIPPQSIQYNEDVLREYQKKWPSSVGQRALKEKVNSPRVIDTPIIPPVVKEEEFELPILPTMVGDYPYKPPLQWGKQKTLRELLKGKPVAQTAPQETDERDKEFARIYKEVYGNKTKGITQRK